MAEIFPDEGLDIILEIFPRGGTNLTTTYLCLFDSFTASTVGTAANGADSYTEPDFGSYARQSVLNTAWGAIAAGTGGRKTTATQVTFPTATSNSTNPTVENQATSPSADTRALSTANLQSPHPVQSPRTRRVASSKPTNTSCGMVPRISTSWRENRRSMNGSTCPRLRRAYPS